MQGKGCNRNIMENIVRSSQDIIFNVIKVTKNNDFKDSKTLGS